MKRSLITIFFLIVSVQFAFTKGPKEEQKSWGYYDAEKVKIIRTHQLTTEGGYRWLKWSPDGEMISANLYGVGLKVFRFSPEGKKLAEIGELPEVHGDNYTFSPDSKMIAYAVKKEGVGFSIWIAKIAKKTIADKRMIVSNDGLEPAWAPDGQKILFKSKEGLGIVNIDGTGLQDLMEGEIWSPSFINDNLVAYLKGSIMKKIKERFWVADEKRYLYSLSLNNLTENLLFPRDIIDNFNWHVAEGKLAKRGKMYCSVYGAQDFIINEDGAEKVELPTDVSFSDFSPDASKFIYTMTKVSEDGMTLLQGEIFIMNTTGVGKKQLTNTPDVIECNPKWSPDGNWILYTDVKGRIFVSKITRHHEHFPQHSK